MSKIAFSKVDLDSSALVSVSLGSVFDDVNTHRRKGVTSGSQEESCRECTTFGQRELYDLPLHSCLL